MPDPLVYQIRSVIFDKNIAYPLSLTGEDDYYVTLTATAVSIETGKVASGVTVYWSCPRQIIRYYDANGNQITTLPVTSTTNTNGEAVITVAATDIAIAQMTAATALEATTQQPLDPYTVTIAFVKPQAQPIQQAAKPLPIPQGNSEVRPPHVYEDGDQNYQTTFEITAGGSADLLNTALVAGFVVHTDTFGTVISKTLLFPSPIYMEGEGGPTQFGELKGYGFPLPYVSMTDLGSSSAGSEGSPHAIQYLYQETSYQVAWQSGWKSVELDGTYWAQPNPYRDQSLTWDQPIVLNGSGQEVPNPTPLTNDFFVYNADKKMWVLRFHVHTENMQTGDKIFPYVYANGYIYGTTIRVSYYLPLGSQTVGTPGDVITIEVPANPLNTIGEGEAGALGQIDVLYLVNQRRWGGLFKDSTAFSPMTS
jgi:hypothetical protein